MKDESNDPPIAHYNPLSGLARLWGGAKGLFYPAVCAGCGRLTGDHHALCAECWQTVTFIERPFCEVLGIPFGHDLGNGILSAEALANPPSFDRLRAAVLYSGVARRIAQSMKYKDRTDLAVMMAEWMVRASDDTLNKADVVIPIPLHRSRLFSRKYNQAAELARHVARQVGKPLLHSALIRTRNTVRQVGLRAGAREENTRGAFAVTGQGMSEVFGRRIVLVDDVYTTGATASAATKMLKAAGAADITVLTFAMALTEII